VSGYNQMTANKIQELMSKGKPIGVYRTGWMGYSDAVIDHCLELRREGMSYVQIGREMGIHYNTVGKYCRRYLSKQENSSSDAEDSSPSD